MLTQQTVYDRFPRVQLWQRAAAFCIDFVAVWLASALLASVIPFFLLFLLLWWLLRALLVERNQGQSPGRYLLNMKVIDSRASKVLDLLTLTKREGIVGFAALLAATGLHLIATNPSALLLLMPLAADCGLAGTESSRRAFHDRVAGTLIVATRRGYSLDLKVKRLVAEVTRHVQK